MATLSSILAWRIPWTKESGRLQSMGSQRTRYNCATTTSLYFRAQNCPVTTPPRLRNPGPRHCPESLTALTLSSHGRSLNRCAKIHCITCPNMACLCLKKSNVRFVSYCTKWTMTTLLVTKTAEKANYLQTHDQVPKVLKQYDLPCCLSPSDNGRFCWEGFSMPQIMRQSNLRLDLPTCTFPSFSNITHSFY